jgi:tRNA threonylcarbamoyladenosine biosynthesis protein TsaB
MKLVLINSNPDNSFAAYYSDTHFIISRTADFMTPQELSNVNKSPDKLIHCLHHISSLPEVNLNEIDAVSVTIGPGSFTGIRVGLAVAKGLADSLEKKIIPINNFELTLNRLAKIENNKKYCILIPAKLPEYYFSITENSREIKSGFVQLSEIKSIIDNNMHIVGDFSDETMEKLNYFSLSSVKNLKPETEAMAELSKKLYESGITYNSEDTKPLYIKDFVIRKA